MNRNEREPMSLKSSSWNKSINTYITIEKGSWERMKEKRKEETNDDDDADADEEKERK